MNRIKLTNKQETELQNEIFFLYAQMHDYIVDEIESYNYTYNYNTLSNDEFYTELISIVKKEDSTLYTELNLEASAFVDEFSYLKISVKELITYSIIISYLKIKNKYLHDKLLKIKNDFNLISLMTIIDIMSKRFAAI